MDWVEAVTVSSLLGDAGTVAGIAAALASALLAGVVLTQGREMRRLRDELREESERALAVEGSLTAQLAAVGRQAPPAAPAPTPAAVPAVAAVASTIDEAGPPAPLAADARPPLGSATAAPEVAEAIAVASRGQGPVAPPTAPGIATAGSPRPAPVVIPAPAAAASRTDAHQAPLGAPSTVAAGAAQRSPKPPPAEEVAPARRRRSPVPFILGGLLVVGIVVFAVSSIGGDSGSTGGGGGVTKTEKKPPANPAAGSIVAVLNGTPVSGLAGQVSRELVRDGFKAGRVATARDQQQSKTVVAYMPGHLTDAEGVVQTLGLESAPVPADDAVQAIACPDPATCNVEVIVTVGSDRTR